MPVPVYASIADGRWRSLGVVKFGNNTIPNVGGTLPWINLNDAVNWYAQEVTIQRDNHALQLVQNAWRGKASWIAEDFTYGKISIPVLYDEQGGGAGVTAALAPLLNSGEQYLTFDNATAVLVKCKSAGAAKRTVNTDVVMFDTTLQFWTREPFFKDLTQTTNLANAVAGSSGAGTATNLTVTYTGTWYSEPVYVLNIPNTNTVSISSLKIANTTSGETLTVTFSPVLSASVAHTITVDSGLFKATDEAAKEYDITGSFPMLYNSPQGNTQANGYTITIVSSAATTGLTFDFRYSSRWIM